MKYNIYVFSLFWEKFHKKTKQKKLNREQSEMIWDKCKFQTLKTALIKDLNRKGFETKLNAYCFLKENL